MAIRPIADVSITYSHIIQPTAVLTLLPTTPKPINSSFHEQSRSLSLRFKRCIRKSGS